MDVQLATKPGGTLHAISVPQSELEAKRFEATMQCQGLTVTRLTQAAAAVRFKRLKFAGQDSPAAKVSAAEALAQQQVQFDTLPPRGMPVRYLQEGKQVTGTVLHALRWPLDHPLCPGRIAVVVETPGCTACVDAGTFEIVTPEQPVPAHLPDDTAEIHVPLASASRPPNPPVYVQPGLW